jgi:hypothetical protein
MLRRLSDPPHPPPAEPTILGVDDRPKVRKLWRRKLRNGTEIECVLWWDVAVEAVLEITVRASRAEDTIAEGIAAGILAALESEGVRPFDAIVAEGAEG